MPELKYRTCNLCEAMCGMVVTVDGGAITDIRGDRDDVLSRGHICPKAAALDDVRLDEDRVREPCVRDPGGGAWRTVDWERALDEWNKSAPGDVDPTDVSRVQKKLENTKVKLAQQKE